MKKKKSKSKVKPKKAKKAKKPVKLKVKAKAKAKAKTGKTAKKSSRKAKAPAVEAPHTIIPPPNSVLLGRVEDYFAKIGVIALTLQGTLRVGDHLHILGHTTNLEQPVASMQIDHQPVTEAAPNSPVGIKVTSRVRRGDHVYLITA